MYVALLTLIGKSRKQNPKIGIWPSVFYGNKIQKNFENFILGTSPSVIYGNKIHWKIFEISILGWSPSVIYGNKIHWKNFEYLGISFILFKKLIIVSNFLYQSVIGFVNSYMLYRELHPSPNLDFQLFLLKISQGLVKDSLKPSMTPLRIRGNELFPRNFCRDCKNLSPRKDCRTSMHCSKCGAGCCRRHSKTVCSRCLS